MGGNIRGSSRADGSLHVDTLEPHRHGVVRRCPVECHGGVHMRAGRCRPGWCMMVMVDGRTGGDWTRWSHALGSGVVHSGGTG